MRLTAFLLLGLLLIVAQGELYLVLDRFHAHDFRPSLLVPLLIYIGVSEANLSLAACVAFLLGYVLDVVGGAPIGLFAFTSVGTVALARVAGSRIVPRGGVWRAVLAGLFAIFGALVANMLLALFSKTPSIARARMGLVVPEALATAIIAPLVYQFAEKTRALAAGFVEPARTASTTGDRLLRTDAIGGRVGSRLGGGNGGGIGGGGEGRLDGRGGSSWEERP